VSEANLSFASKWILYYDLVAATSETQSVSSALHRCLKENREVEHPEKSKKLRDHRGKEGSNP